MGPAIPPATELRHVWWLSGEQSGELNVIIILINQRTLLISYFDNYPMAYYSLCPRHRHTSADHCERIEDALEHEAGQGIAVGLRHGVLDEVFANHITAGVDQQHTAQFVDESWDNSRPQSLETLLCNDLAEGTEYSRVLCLLSNELCHDAHRDDLEGMREDHLCCRDRHLSLQLLVKVLVQHTVIGLALDGLLVRHRLQLQFVRNSLRGKGAQEGTHNPRGQATVAPGQTVGGANVCG